LQNYTVNMQFHLNHIPEKPGFTIDHTHSVFLMGSCFSSNIGSLLSDHKFKITVNPNGILFNPSSIFTSLQTILKQHHPEEKSILQRGENFYSYFHHSSVNAGSKEKLVEEIVDTNKKNLEFIKKCDYLIITFGTAFHYHHKGLNTTVANCHKRPGNLFEKKLLSVSQITEQCQSLLNDLKVLNTKLKVIFTVSPVKYLKDGVVENTLSKSTLILAIHDIIRANQNCFYFPAYELVNDDLRDYRFYKEDLAHPNEQAIKYIWEKFSTCYFSSATQSLNKLIHELNQAVEHRQMQKNDSETLKLKDFIEKKEQVIRKLFPAVLF